VTPEPHAGKITLVTGLVAYHSSPLRLINLPLLTSGPSSAALLFQ